VKRRKRGRNRRSQQLVPEGFFRKRGGYTSIRTGEGKNEEFFLGVQTKRRGRIFLTERGEKKTDPQFFVIGGQRRSSPPIFSRKGRGEARYRRAHLRGRREGKGGRAERVEDLEKKDRRFFAIKGVQRVGDAVRFEGGERRQREQR